VSRPEGFWDWSLAVYAKPGVKEACLALQDGRGVDVNLALWCCWLAASGRRPGPALEPARAFAESWRAVVAPLRRARDALKPPPEGADPDAAAQLRRTILDVELDAERVAQTRLEDLARGAEPDGREARILAAANLTAAHPRVQGADFTPLLDAAFA
jgi:uncharacterized protein (TIGR02444 family)